MKTDYGLIPGKCKKSSHSHRFIFVLLYLAILHVFPQTVYSAQVSLEWDANKASDLAGYKIHYGISSRDYDTTVDIGNYSSCTISELQEGQTYYFAATAYDNSGNETGFSNEVSTQIILPDTNGPADDKIGGISNVSVNSGKTYEPVQNGAEYGKLVYIDRTYTFTQVPEYLQGATYIKTANGDKNSKGDNFLSFYVNQDVTIYIGYDIRIGGTPSWLINFTDTGDEIATSDTTFRLFAKDLPSGTITLGGNESGGGYSMYTVVIVP